MMRRRWFVLGLSLGVPACAESGPSTTAAATASPDSGASTAGEACVACLADSDCSGGICAQFGSDIYCAPECGAGAACSSDRTCTVVTSAAGDQKSVCVPTNEACGAPVTASTSDASAGACAPVDAGSSSTSCGALLAPSVTAACASCGAHPCQPNGCYGGWWCDSTTKKCHAPPSNCAPSEPVPGCGFDAGGSISGTVGENGGIVSRLYFAIVGDTRPPVINDTNAYPSAIITRIYKDIAALSPMPPFAVSTGDYIFSSPIGGPSASQLDLYLAARRAFPGVLYPAMGNHECTGAAASNCGAGNANGTPTNYTDFLTKMLSPIKKALPYYAFTVSAVDATWTAKFVMVAGNAWDAGQSTWLETTLAQPTTYTFVVRHESATVSAPGVAPSEQIMARHPYTIAIVGHTHTYGRTGARQVTIGNGGAPLTGTVNYGFGLALQRADGAIQFDMVDYQSGQTDASFRFALKPDGTPAP